MNNNNNTNTLSPFFSSNTQPTTFQPPQPTFQQPSQPTFQQPSQPTFQPPSQPTFQPPSQPTFQPSQPTFQPSQPTFQQPSQPTFQSNMMDNMMTPTFNKIGEVAESVQKSVNDILPQFPSLESIKPITAELPSHEPESKTRITKFFDFFSFNSIVTKIAFLLFIIILFLILVKLSMSIIVYAYQQNNNPTLVSGTIAGTTPIIISRDPNKSESITLPRSNNQYYGAEFTWSVWLNVNSVNETLEYSHIFNIGNNNPLPNGIMSINNAPGVYFMQSKSNANQTGYSLGMRVVMDTEPYHDYTQERLSTQSPVSHNKFIDITELPFNNWFHVVIRLENSVLDIYINGTIAGRINFETVPKQNFYNVQICQNGGFQGHLSNLKYYASALNIFDINALVLAGPNLSAPNVVGAVNNPAILPTGQLNSYDYLSSLWYYRESTT